MRFNKFGSLTGVKGGEKELWVWGLHDDDPTPLGIKGGSGQWYQDNFIAVRAEPHDIITLLPGRGVSVLHPGGANALLGGGPTWAANLSPKEGPIVTWGVDQGVPFHFEGMHTIAIAEDGSMAQKGPMTLERIEITWESGGGHSLPSTAEGLRIRDGLALFKLGRSIRLMTERGEIELPVLFGSEQWPLLAFRSRDGKEIWIMYTTDAGFIALHKVGFTVGYRFEPPIFDPDIYFIPDGRAILAYATGDGEEIGFIHRSAPFKLGDGMVELGTLPPPVEPPIEPPQEPVMLTPEQKSKVLATIGEEAMKHDLKGAETEDERKRACFNFVCQVALKLRANGFDSGVLSKPSGNAVDGFAVDVITIRFPGNVVLHYDIVSNAGSDEAGTTFVEHGAVEASRFAMPPCQAGEPPVPPVEPPTEPPSNDVAKEIAKLRAELQEFALELGKDITAILTAVEESRAKSNEVAEVMTRLIGPTLGSLLTEVKRERDIEIRAGFLGTLRGKVK